MTCFRLLTHEIERAFSRAFDSAGSSMAARMAMIAMTTSSSMSVKLRWRRFLGVDIGRLVFMAVVFLGGVQGAVWQNPTSAYKYYTKLSLR